MKKEWDDADNTADTASDDAWDNAYEDDWDAYKKKQEIPDEDT